MIARPDNHGGAWSARRRPGAEDAGLTRLARGVLRLGALVAWAVALFGVAIGSWGLTGRALVAVAVLGGLWVLLWPYQGGGDGPT